MLIARSFLLTFFCIYLFITTDYCNTDDRRRMGGCVLSCVMLPVCCATINVVPDSSTVHSSM